MYKSFFKPLLDFFVSITCIIVLSPVLAIISILVLIDNKGQLLFFQNRAGKQGNIFKIIKVKTMSNKKGEHGNLLPKNERLTILGKFLRKYSLDEIPQLFNVIKGEMSIIGPRPLHTKYLSIYTKEQSRRHEVDGGISGWAQVNGRNNISWGEKFKLDVWYVDNISFLLDMKILWLTLVKVINKENVNRSKDVTMPPFTNMKND
jgi:undecaprenyl phosphate N,N'-diacetylbacillosamine 1-phosphate transferase